MQSLAMTNSGLFRKYLTSLGVVLCFLSFFTSCLEPNDYAKRQRAWLGSTKGLRVLCTTEMIEALVEAIGGEYVDTLALVYGELDPHSYQLVKGDDEKMAKAEAIFCNGLGLEHGPSLKSALERHPKIYYLGDELAEIDRKLIIDHGSSVDPHIWLDVGLFAKLCPLIAKHLSAIDPKHAGEFAANSKRTQSSLNQLHRTLFDQFQAIDSKKRHLVTSHEAFFYLTRAYLASETERISNEGWEERFCAPEGLAPESQISLARILEIAKYIQKYQVPTAFLEINVNSDAVYKVQEVLKSSQYCLNIPDQPLYSDSMPSLKAEEGSTSGAYSRYLEMMTSNAAIILKSWRRSDAS